VPPGVVSQPPLLQALPCFPVTVGSDFTFSPRLDLAVEMRARLGDWFKVQKLATQVPLPPSSLSWGFVFDLRGVRRSFVHDASKFRARCTKLRRHGAAFPRRDAPRPPPARPARAHAPGLTRRRPLGSVQRAGGDDQLINTAHGAQPTAPGAPREAPALTGALC
jgi:hypothetical protein